MRRTRSGFGRVLMLGVSCAIGLAAVTDCGNSDDAASGKVASSGDGGVVAPASGSIGAAGGMVSASDGTSVTIPAGALPTTTTITVTPSPGTPLSSAFTAVGPTYIMGPEGLQFVSPITLTLDVEPSLYPAGKTEADVLVYTAPLGSTAFSTLPTTVRDANHVAAPSLHFSIFVAGVPRAASADDGGASSDAGGVEGGLATLPDGGVVDTIATPDEAAGTRLHPMYKRATFGDGAVTLTPAAMFDAQRNETCDATLLADGQYYCAPAATTAVYTPDTYFTDAACTAPLVGAYDSFAAPLCADVAVPRPNRYFVTQPLGACATAPARIFTVPATGQITATTVYAKSGGTCTATSFAPTAIEAYPLAAMHELTAADLMAVTRTQPTATGTGRLTAAPLMNAGSDGSRWAVDGAIVDGQTASFCSVELDVDEALRCLPTSAPYQYYTHDYYSDSACKAGVAYLQPGPFCGSDPRQTTAYAVITGYTPDVCLFNNVVSLTGDTPITSVYTNDTGSCAPATGLTAGTYLAGPTPVAVAATNFVAVTQGAREATSYGVDGTRIHAENVHTVGADGSDVAALAVSAVDTQSNLACTPLVLEDGQVHCVPPSLPFVASYGPTGTSNVYADSACTQRLVEVNSPFPDCVRTRPHRVYAELGGAVGSCTESTMYSTTAEPLPLNTPYYGKGTGTCAQVATISQLSHEFFLASDMTKVDATGFVAESIALETR